MTYSIEKLKGFLQGELEDDSVVVMVLRLQHLVQVAEQFETPVSKFVDNFRDSLEEFLLLSSVEIIETFRVSGRELHAKAV